MLMKFSEKAQKAIVVAEGVAFNLGHQNVGSEHLLLSILKMPDLLFSTELKKYHVTDQTIETDLQRLFGETKEQLFYMEYTNIFKNILESAIMIGQKRQENRISIESLCLALLQEKQSVAHELLASYHVDFERVTRALENTRRPGGELAKIADLINLNEKVRRRKPVIIGRDEELATLVEILCRKEKNNVLIVGDAGVGKTALVEKLALMMNTLEEDHPLYGKQIYELDLASVVAGTKYRGEFEDKLKKIIDQVKADGEAIIFIDEIHNLVGAGGAEGAIDASNILKPYLARKEVTCIGATTYEEYRRYFEKDRALNRRFGKIDLKEEDEEATFKILKGLKRYFEKYHQVKLSIAVLKNIVCLSTDYIKERHQPDIAIDVLDLACVKTRMAGQKEVTEETVKQVIEGMTGINLHQEAPLKALTSILKEKIHGQDGVIDELIEQLALSEAGLCEKDQPRLVLMFAGPTGVGKTEIAKLLAQHYYGHLIRLDLSEYRESHSVSKIIGSPPGYIGYEQSSRFLDEVRRHPHSVVLLDEMDKAHPDVWHLFLQVFDEGSLEDSQKNKVDFSNSLVIMTTNMGYHQVQRGRVGFQDDREMKTKHILESRFSLEFLNRIDHIFYFDYLKKEDCKDIMMDYLQHYRKDVSSWFKNQDSLLDQIIEKSEVEKYGARALQRTLRQEIYERYLKQTT